MDTKTDPIPFQRLVDTFRDATKARSAADHEARRLARRGQRDRRTARALAHTGDANHQVTHAADLITQAGGRVEWGRGGRVTVFDGRGRARLTIAA